MIGKIGNLVSSIFAGEKGIANGIADIADRFIHTKEEKNDFKIQLERFGHQKEIELIEKGQEIEQEFNKRIVDMEGTAKDLAGFGWIGKIVVLLRGSFRPLVSYAMAIVDFMVFSGRTELPDNDQVVSSFWIINLVIFTFYFGERAIKNIIPVLSMYFGKTIKNKL